MMTCTSVSGTLGYGPVWLAVVVVAAVVIALCVSYAEWRDRTAAAHHARELRRARRAR